VLEQLFETFDRLRREIAIIIVDHNLGLALALSDRKGRGLRRKVLWL
jgi:ABC-type branched-subunit amino acid transport system ATPase component